MHKKHKILEPIYIYVFCSGACWAVPIARAAAHMNTAHSEKCAISTKSVNQLRRKWETFCFAQKFENKNICEERKFLKAILCTSGDGVISLVYVQLNIYRCYNHYLCVCLSLFSILYKHQQLVIPFIFHVGVQNIMFFYYLRSSFRGWKWLLDEKATNKNPNTNKLSWAINYRCGWHFRCTGISFVNSSVTDTFVLYFTLPLPEQKFPSLGGL